LKRRGWPDHRTAAGRATCSALSWHTHARQQSAINRLALVQVWPNADRARVTGIVVRPRGVKPISMLLIHHSTIGSTG
jgi:hypothetical protein